MREPVGVVAAIVPWNAPLVIDDPQDRPPAARGLHRRLKPAPETPLDAYLIAEARSEAGLPTGVLNVVPGGREVGEHLVATPASTRSRSPAPPRPAAQIAESAARSSGA